MNYYAVVQLKTVSEIVANLSFAFSSDISGRDGAAVLDRPEDQLHSGCQAQEVQQRKCRNLIG
jgi:hypothetical protein